MVIQSAAAPTSIVCPVATSPLALRCQSACDYRGDSHLDGWGIGWYEQGRPRVIRSLRPAPDDADLASAAAQASSTIALAHVRKASVGTLTLENTHPFVHGPWMFAHNGTVYEFDRVGPRLVEQTTPSLQAERRGSTDSEQMFLWLLSKFERAGLSLDAPAPDAARLLDLLTAGLHEFLAICRALDPKTETALNFALTDGRTVVTSRWRRTLWTRKFSLDESCPECGQRHAPQATNGAAVLVASQPTSRDSIPSRGDWQELRDGDLLAITPDQQVLRRRLD